MNSDLMMLLQIIATFIIGWLFPMMAMTSHQHLSAQKDEIFEDTTGWVLFKLIFTLVPCFVYIYAQYFDGDSITLKGLVLCSVFAISYLGKVFSRKLPIILSSLMKESPLVILCLIFGWTAISAFVVEPVSTDTKPMFVSFLVLLLSIVGLMKFGGNRIVSSFAVQFSGERQIAKIVDISIWRPNNLPLHIVDIMYQLPSGGRGHYSVLEGPYSAVNVEKITNYKRGKEIEVWYSPWFGGVTYYNRR
jgi:hypothetical protein